MADYTGIWNLRVTTLAKRVQQSTVSEAHKPRPGVHDRKRQPDDRLLRDACHLFRRSSPHSLRMRGETTNIPVSYRLLPPKARDNSTTIFG